MSKTDKTNPLWVKITRGDVASEEIHNHSDGVCDLPADGSLAWSRGQRCRREFVYTGTHTCCCHWCHSEDTWEIPPGKRQRIDGKEICRNWEDEEGHYWSCRCEDCELEYLLAEGYLDVDDDEESAYWQGWYWVASGRADAGLSANVAIFPYTDISPWRAREMEEALRKAGVTPVGAAVEAVPSTAVPSAQEAGEEEAVESSAGTCAE